MEKNKHCKKSYDDLSTSTKHSLSTQVFNLPKVLTKSSNDKLYYYRLVISSIQKAKKELGIPFWFDIVVSWSGEPKYSLNSLDAIEYIEKNNGIKLLNCNDCQNNSKLNIIHSCYFENIDIVIHLYK